MPQILDLSGRYKNNIQNRDGLPDALIEEKRFFELYSSDKAATPAGWNNSENWKNLDDIPEGRFFGFAIGNGTNYLLIDFDHVRNPETGDMVSWALAAYLRMTKVGKTYTELSMSGTGFHMICDLGDYADNFSRESNGYRQIIVAMDPEKYQKLPKDEKDKIPKIEFFYHAEGRYVYLTGKHNKLIQVAKDETAAAIFTELLQIRKEFHEKYAEKPCTADDAVLTVDDATRQRILEALPYISANGRETWVTVGIALSNCGFPFEVWDNWSQFTDQRTGEICDKYDPEETPKIWKSFKNSKSHWNAGTIIKLAKENGYQTDKSEDKRSIRPYEFSDVEQAEIFVSQFGDRVRYSKATGFLTYSGKVWEAGDLKAQKLSQLLTEKQLGDAKRKLWEARYKHDKLTEKNTSEVAGADFSDAVGTEAALDEAEAYRKAVIKRRSSQRISATLTEVAPKVEIDVRDLDRDGYLLNTPGGTVNLRTGEIRKHNPGDYCTKITAVAPGTEGKDLFDEFLDQITCQDTDLKRYLQEISGEFAVGVVKREELFIASGGGGNGKSTFFNLLYKVFGDYAGLISSDVLVTNNQKNKAPELASLRGKRMIIAAELDEGKLLDSSMIKKIASMDPIRAEQKYRDPFDFIPSHSIVLYTNFLPKVGARDSGTWDRLVIIPFNARFRNMPGEVKDYASVLFDKCGGAVLSWIIEGAKRFIENDFFISLPECVSTAIRDYRDNNDWLKNFLEARCYVGLQYRETAGNLYKGYRDYCASMGDFTRSSPEFKQALECIGIEHKKTKTGMVYRGVELKKEIDLKADEEAAKKEA